MHPLDLKLLRDARALRTQLFAVALVMACGLAMMIMTRSLMGSLEHARDSYYRDQRFGDLFASLKRAPSSFAAQIAALPGVAAVEPSLRVGVTLDVPGLLEPASGLVHSLPDRRDPLLDRPVLRAGRALALSSADEVLVGEAFAEARNIQPGGTLNLLLNGRLTTLRVVGIVLAPHYVFEAPPGSALPDPRTFGVFWMREKALAEAFDLDGAFNQISVLLGPGARPAALIADLDRLLEPWGGLGAYDRDRHPGNRRVTDEINVLRGLSFGFPLVFLSVAAFMTHSVLARLITLQREQIAVLKAFGFANSAIGFHYLKFALLIVAAGTTLGTLGGFFLGHKIVAMYHLFFRFPDLAFMPAWGAILAAAAASACSALIGVAVTVRRIARLAPAEAMRPEPPADFRPSLLERLGPARHASVPLRMALRNLARKPLQAALTTSALALATAILVVPSSFRDGIRHVLDFQWDVVQRQTVTVALQEPGPLRALADLRALPGVILAEPFRSVPVELAAGPRTRRVSLNGLPATATLQRLTDARGHPFSLPPHGLVLSHALADALGLAPGDSVEVRVLQGKRVHQTLPVVAITDDFAGTAAYLELDALNRFLREGDRLSGAHLTVAAGQWPAFLTALKATPGAAGVMIKNSLRESFRKTTAESIGLIQMLYRTFAIIVAAGICYNSARIALSERTRELATLRVLGFTVREVSIVLIGEIVLLALVAMPFGLVLGSGIAASIIATVSTETIRLPLILTPANYAFAVLVVTLATAASLWLACRRLSQLDLVSVLKARD
ncbi:MAG: ABC transporter permease [Verrucomicrobia bacterium]|nr:ABC transporter permease [Verrucomicrobiota bacterium]